MSEKLEMEIVGKNSTTKGWDQVEADAKKRAKKIQDAVGREGGIFGDTGKVQDKGGSGKGFSEAFLKAFRGDISGALEELTGRMGGAMKGLAGKATVWGAGIATALAAGWKAGGMIDDMLGISDKVAKAWNRAAVAAGKSWDDFYKGLRTKRLQQEAEIKSVVDTESKIFDIREKAKMKRMSGAERVDYLQEGIDTLERTSSAPGLSLDEKSAMKVQLEEMKADYLDALDVMRAEYDAKVKKDWEATQAAEKAKAEAIKAGVEKEAALTEMLINQEIDGIERAKEARKEQSQSDLAAIDAKIARLKQLAALEGAWRGMGDQAADPKSWAAAQKAAKDEERDRRRRAKMHEEAEAAKKRGVKIPPRWQALLDADHAAAAAAAAGKQARDLEKEAQEANIQAAKDIRKMQKDVEALQDTLKRGLTMGGAD